MVSFEIESLVLVLVDTQLDLGFNEHVWEGPTSMPHLHTLCMTVPTATGPLMDFPFCQNPDVEDLEI